MRAYAASVRWWEAGGLHVHVRHPDNVWERFVFPRGEWWQVDAIIADIQRTYGKENVQVDG